MRIGTISTMNKWFSIHTRERDCRGHLGLDPVPLAWINKRNVWPVISCSIRNAILGELKSLYFRGSLFYSVLPGILLWGIIPTSSWDVRRNLQQIIPYSLKTDILGEFISPCLLNSLVLPVLSEVLTWVIIPLSLSSLETGGGLWPLLRHKSICLSLTDIVLMKG